ncbi:MAG: EamA family transporter [Planctomycetota bacterium]
MFLSVASAVCLGIYDIAKKLSVRDNAVPIVLWISVSVGCCVWAITLCVQTLLAPSVTAACFPSWMLVEPISWRIHVALFAKSALVGCSWTLAFFSLKHLPLSIAAPVRSTSPLWTLLLAVTFLDERPDVQQSFGIAIVLISFWLLSVQGAKEGIRFRSNRWIGLMVAATILGSLSGIYDKILLQTLCVPPATVQAWFSIYLLPVMTPLAWIWLRRNRRVDSQRTTPNGFDFRWSILMISPLLLVTDMLYFVALSNPDALVSVVSSLRRCSVVVAMVLGKRLKGEVNVRRKLLCVAGLLLGVVLLLF